MNLKSIQRQAYTEKVNRGYRCGTAQLKLYASAVDGAASEQASYWWG